MQTPTSGSTARRRWARCLGTGATAIVTATVVGSAAGAATPANAPIGAFGSVAAIAGSSMEVQNPNSGQTTVNWTSTTQFSKTVSEAVSSVTVGSCVTATGTPSKSSKTTIAVRSVNVTTASSTGSCTGGATRVNGGPGGAAGGNFRVRNGNFPGGNGAPGGAPKSLPSSIRNRLGDFSIASGKVTAVNGSTLTVSGISVSPGSFAPRYSKSSKSKHPTAPKTQTLKLTTTSSTTVSARQSVASSDVAVGDCVSAFGPAASNGSVTADTVQISSSVNGSCTGGFTRIGEGSGGPGGGFPGGGGGEQFFGGGGA